MSLTLLVVAEGLCTARTQPYKGTMLATSFCFVNMLNGRMTRNVNATCLPLLSQLLELAR